MQEKGRQEGKEGGGLRGEQGSRGRGVEAVAIRQARNPGGLDQGGDKWSVWDFFFFFFFNIEFLTTTLLY